jgi:hypothetical protein
VAAEQLAVDGPPRVTHVLSLLEGIAPTSLFDIGSGHGAFPWPLVAQFPALAVTAVDRLDHRVRDIDAVRAGGIDRVRAQVGDVTALPFADGAFDVVTILKVFEHLRDPSAAAAIAWANADTVGWANTVATRSSRCVAAEIDDASFIACSESMPSSNRLSCTLIWATPQSRAARPASRISWSPCGATKVAARSSPSDLGSRASSILPFAVSGQRSTIVITLGIRCAGTPPASALPSAAPFDALPGRGMT